jgi:hypothetical protein
MSCHGGKEISKLQRPTNRAKLADLSTMRASVMASRDDLLAVWETMREKRAAASGLHGYFRNGTRAY